MQSRRLPRNVLGLAALVLVCAAALAATATAAGAATQARRGEAQSSVGSARVAAGAHRHLHGRGKPRVSRRAQAANAHPASQPAPSPSESELAFEGGFDSPAFSEWPLLQSMSGRTTTVSGSPYRGGADARFEVRPGDIEPQTGSQRAEVTGPTFGEGADLYIRDAIRVPTADTSEGPWLIVQQLHDYSATYNGSPGMAVFLDPGPSLRLGPGNGSTTFWQTGKIEENRWYELVYHVKLSHDPSVGFVEVWLDGVQQKLTNGQTRAYGQTMIAEHTYLKAGIYRSAYSTGTAVVEHDDVAVGSSLASVLGR